MLVTRRSSNPEERRFFLRQARALPLSRLWDQQHPAYRLAALDVGMRGGGL